MHRFFERLGWLAAATFERLGAIVFVRQKVLQATQEKGSELDVVLFFGFADFEQANDVGMAQGGGGAGFASETLDGQIARGRSEEEGV